MNQRHASLEDVLLNLLRSSDDDGLELNEIISLSGNTESDRRLIERTLRKLARQGSVSRVSRRRWCASGSGRTLNGTLRWTGKRHEVECDSIGVVVVQPRHVGPAAAGDEVHVRLSGPEGTSPAEGEITRFESRAPRVVQGRIQRRGRIAIVESSMLEEPVLIEDTSTVEQDTERVRVRISGRAPRSYRLAGVPARPLVGDIIDPLRALEPQPGPTARQAFALVQPGELHATRLLDQLANSLGIDLPFSSEALEIAARARAPRKVVGEDLTGEPLVTIDGASAKDFDDAVAAERVGPEIRLLVAIADVSHYVPEGSLLDTEARERGCSVYLPGRVYPMLPFRLSDDLCSLRPGVLRRCAWVSLILDRAGDIVDIDAGFGTLRSRHRLTYEQVQAHLDGHPLDVEDDVAASLEALDEARRRLHVKRVERGMLDLDLPETEIRLSEDGAGVQEVEPSQRLRAHRLIEECMLAANEAVASLLTGMGWPHIRRVHRDPNEERVLRVTRIANSIGVRFDGKGVPDVNELNEALARVQGRPESRALSYLLLRSLSAAEYSTDSAAHYGIGAPAYLHFTSPIRRYADLEVHRTLRMALHTVRSSRPPAPLTERLNRSAEYANRGEQLATRAERYASRLLSARYMLDRVGDEFSATVMEVASFGLFVSLGSPNVEGLVPIRKLGREYFEFDEESLQLRGSRTGTVFAVGSRLRVRCDSVDLSEGRISFVALPGDVPLDQAPDGAVDRPFIDASWGADEGGVDKAASAKPSQPPRPRRRSSRRSGSSKRK
ncbi:MAG: VacB/RNase II family 3'-5' exoribonuclease [Deltaproteobacteria bacterium]|nr:MAG: VacB/RNase II family 3'-5' exoribonuclease [Deltaproteobacteria bacterium]